jgi:hypothetical protein
LEDELSCDEPGRQGSVAFSVAFSVAPNTSIATPEQHLKYFTFLSL